MFYELIAHFLIFVSMFKIGKHIMCSVHTISPVRLWTSDSQMPKDERCPPGKSIRRSLGLQDSIGCIPVAEGFLFSRIPKPSSSVSMIFLSPQGLEYVQNDEYQVARPSGWFWKGWQMSKVVRRGLTWTYL